MPDDFCQFAGEPPREFLEPPSDWPEPMPLDYEIDLPSFPLDVLPTVLQSFVAALAHETQTDPGMAAMLAIGTLAACAQRSRYLKIRTGWNEPLGIYCGCAAAPSERKSGVVQRCMAPINAWESDQTETYHRALADYENDPTGRDRPVCQRAATDDVTPERMVTLAAEQGGSIAVLTSEGSGPFAIAAGRYSKNGGVSFDVLLKGHAGDALRVDRQGRDSVFIPRPAWTFVVTCQPDALRRLFEIPGARGQGLLARFLYVFPRSHVGKRSMRAESMPEIAVQAWGALLRRLLDEPSGDRRPLVFDDAARECLIVFAEELEPRLGPGGSLRAIGDWAGKLAGALARVAALFALAEDSRAEAVYVDAVTRAIGLAEYLIAHARAAFGLASQDPVTEQAGHVLVWIRAKGLRRFSKRDTWRALHGREWCTKAADVDAPMARLVEHGWIRSEPVVKTGGRDGSQTFAVHPRIHDSASVPEVPKVMAENPSGTFGTLAPYLAGHYEGLAPYLQARLRRRIARGENPSLARTLVIAGEVD